MAMKLLKLTSGQNIRLATIAARLATLCGSYLYDGSTASDEDALVIEKGREHFDFVKSGLAFQNNELTGFSFDPETLHSIKALEEVHLAAPDIEKALDNVEKTFLALEGKQPANSYIIKGAFDFFTRLSKQVKKSHFNAEASHTL